MIKKQKLIEENDKLKRKLFIWENIGIGRDSPIKEKEIAILECLLCWMIHSPQICFFIFCSCVINLLD